ncbi:hypothetical protein ACOSP6_11970 [Tenacibaculum sp. MEBiC06402]|uniref:hypothetical protein n=1 Tax=unclassified Tenacibaculum TaxID=2635139 RepID=UPI003B9C0052
MKHTQDPISKVKNMINFLFLLFFLFNCSSYKKHNTNNDIEEILSLLSKKESIYYKTINQDLDQSLGTFINLNSFDFELCIDGKEVIVKEEIKYIKEKIKDLKKVNLKRLYPKIGFKTKREHSKASFISYPILFRENKAAIYYQKGRYGGSFSLLIKKQNKWIYKCSKSIWIE